MRSVIFVVTSLMLLGCDSPAVAAEESVLNPSRTIVARIYRGPTGEAVLEVCSPDLKECAFVVQAYNLGPIKARWVDDRELQVGVLSPIVRAGPSIGSVGGGEYRTHITQCDAFVNVPCPDWAMDLFCVKPGIRRSECDRRKQNASAHPPN